MLKHLAIQYYHMYSVFYNIPKVSWELCLYSYINMLNHNKPEKHVLTFTFPLYIVNLLPWRVYAQSEKQHVCHELRWVFISVAV